MPNEKQNKKGDEAARKLLSLRKQSSTEEGTASSCTRAERIASKGEDLAKSTTDFSQSLLDEMESMFRSLDSRRRDEPSTSAKQSESANSTDKLKCYRIPAYGVYRSQTLTKAERKKGFPTSTMKPMSAHDEKTLNTAVAMANEITSKSMNDLGGEKKYPHSPNDRSKFHFKFPLSLHHGAHPHEPEKDKDVTGKQERRNFSEEAKSVPDLQPTLPPTFLEKNASTITAESKMAYASLIEEPTPSTSLMSQLAKESASGILKPATVPKPARALSHVQFHSLQKNMPHNARLQPGQSSHEEYQKYTKNVLPLPPRTTKPKLVDKPRHIRKYPLKLPGGSKTPRELPHEAQAIIYQNTNNPAQKQDTKVADVDKGVDVFDGIDTSTNPFTSVAGPSNANPFRCYYDDGYDHELDIRLNTDSETDSEDTERITVLVKDCKDHVSVEDLLEFADQKPCGRQRGVESDEVRIMCKVLKEQSSPEQCLQALELTDWDVHRAIKMVRVKVSVGTNVSFEDCRVQLDKTNGDVVKATARLVSCNSNT